MIFADINWLSITTGTLMVIFAIVCLLMCIIILMQRPKNEGLGAAFGSGTTDQLFGAQTTNVLQRTTIWLGSIFFILVLTLSILMAKAPKPTTLVKEAPAATTSTDKTPATTPAESETKDSAPVVLPAPPATTTAPEEKPLEPEQTPPPVDTKEAPPAETPATPEITPPAEKPAEEQAPK